MKLRDTIGTIDREKEFIFPKNHPSRFYDYRKWSWIIFLLITFLS
jgi:hypothetical protein